MHKEDLIDWLDENLHMNHQITIFDDQREFPRNITITIFDSEHGPGFDLNNKINITE